MLFENSKHISFEIFSIKVECYSDMEFNLMEKNTQY